MIKRLSLGNKLFIYFILLGMIIIAVICGLAYQQAKTAILERTFEQLTSVRVTKQRQLERFFTERRQDLWMLTQSGEMSSLIRELKYFSSPEYKPVSKNIISSPFITHFFVNYHYYSGLLIKLNSGQLYYLKPDSTSLTVRVLDTVPDVFQTKNINGSEEDIFIGSNYRKFYDTDSPNLLMIKHRNPLFHDTVVAALSISFSAVNQVMHDNMDYRGLGQTGETYAVGPDYYLRSTSRFSGTLPTGHRFVSAAIVDALAGREGTGITADYRGVTVLCSFGRISLGDFHWAILAEIDWSEAMAPVEKFKQYLLAISLILITALFISSYTIAKRITKPISRLRRAVGTLQRGEFAEPVDIITNDELGELTDGFNQMASQLKDQTKRLQEREQRLRHFYDAPLDGIIFHDNNKIMMTNHAVIRMTGFSAESLTGRHIDEIIIPNDRQPSAETGFFETQAIRKNGTTFPVEIQHHPIEFNGAMMQVAVMRDITLRKLAEKTNRDERITRISSVIDGQEQERQRLARELHDGLGQYLVAIKLRIENALSSSPEKMIPILTETRTLCDTTIDEARRISNDLMPAVLYELGFLTALKNLCSELSGPDSMVIRCRLTAETIDFDERIQMYLYRIAQESLTNTVRHARADSAELLFHADSDSIMLQISDNGKGFDAESVTASQSRGLHNIRTRVNLLKGTLSIQSAPHSGTTVFVQIPRHQELSI